VRQELETATQALALENSKTDDDLAAATTRWRAAARMAAEALFSAAADKVNQMGGPGGDGWREVVNRGKKNWGWDEDERKKGADEDESGEGGDEGIGGEEEKAEEERKQQETDEEWGMGLLLKSLGVKEDVLGWDSEGACWKD
jgi:Swi5-dependent recombination DNA repair protein 1